MWFNRTVAIAMLAAGVLTGGPARGEGKCVLGWPMLKPEPQTVEAVETLDLPTNIHAYRFGPFAGEFAKLYAFFLDGGDCYVKAVVAGSYEDTTRFARESGDIAPRARLYHLDVYDPDRHATIGFSKEPYTFQQVREAALEHLK